ncbi:EthD family reductase [Sphingobium nicotianae]|uniref:EthD family reductase n=1 Tax=Sphingobium nicotianae TaxID=2782607 RepID=A0A9X1IRD6_9SPHN|nr:EthD family reductase [Sphingobium nicotianae]MBT2187378.1 EthD family reductase [Sphingobium nicotianae]
MHKIVVLYPPQPDPDAFKAYYEATHIPLVRKLPGVLGFRYSFNVEALGGESPYFCIFEADFADGAAMGAALQSPEGGAVAGDVPNFAPVSPTLIHYPVTGGM